MRSCAGSPHPPRPSISSPPRRLPCRAAWKPAGRSTPTGPHHFGPLEARLGDPFGLFPRRIRVAPKGEVIVFPAIHPLHGIAPQWAGGNLADVRGGRPVDVPPDVSSI